MDENIEVQDTSINEQELIIEDYYIRATTPQLILAYISGVMRGSAISQVLTQEIICQVWIQQEMDHLTNRLWYKIRTDIINYLSRIARVKVHPDIDEQED